MYPWQLLPSRDGAYVWLDIISVPWFLPVRKGAVSAAVKHLFLLKWE